MCIKEILRRMWKQLVCYYFTKDCKNTRGTIDLTDTYIIITKKGLDIICTTYD